MDKGRDVRFIEFRVALTDLENYTEHQWGGGLSNFKANRRRKFENFFFPFSFFFFSSLFSLYFFYKWIFTTKGHEWKLLAPSLQKSGDKIEFSLTRHAMADRPWQFCVLRISTIPRIVRRFKLHFIAAAHCGQGERRLFSKGEKGERFKFHPRSSIRARISRFCLVFADRIKGRVFDT